MRFKMWKLMKVAFLLVHFFITSIVSASNDSIGVWDMAALHKLPKTKDMSIDGSGKSFLFESVVFEGRPTSVYAYYSDPDLLSGQQTDRIFPAVVLVHGGGGRVYKEWVQKWAAQGYAAVAMDLSGRDSHGNRLADGGPEQTDENKIGRIDYSPLQDLWTYHSVASIILSNSWLRVQKQVDPERIFITGISWGGYLTCIVASIDDRFKAAAPVYGCGFFWETDVFGEQIEKLSEKGKSAWITNFDPSQYLNHAKVPFLFINGNKDTHFNILPYHKTYMLVPEHNRNVCIVPDMKHSHIQGWLPPEIKSYFDHFAFGYVPILKLGEIMIKGDKLCASYLSKVPLLSASFYYSADTVSANKDRKWSSVVASYDHATGLVETTMPSEGFVYGFFLITDHRGLRTSSEYIMTRLNP